MKAPIAALFALFASCPLYAAVAAPAGTTAEMINQTPSRYFGQNVSFDGKVDRVLGQGAYLVTDPSHSKEINHRILVLTDNTHVTTNGGGSDIRQQPGTVALDLKEGDSIHLNGKVKKLATSMTVIVVEPGAIQGGEN